MWRLALTAVLAALPFGQAQNHCPFPCPTAVVFTVAALWSKTTYDSHNPLDGFHSISTEQFGNDSLSVTHDPAGGSNDVLRVFYKKGSYSHVYDHKGAQFFSMPIPSQTSLTLSYDVFFSPGFDFVMGGKLPGLFGGGYNCSGGRKSEECFSTRFMWRTNGDGEVYAYQTEHQDSNYCHRSGVYCDDHFGNSLGRGKWRFTAGKWHNVAQHVQLNTPGKTNGLLKVWLDNKLVFQLDKVAFISKSMKIDGLFFSTFFGGGSAEWAATHDCYTYFKNFVFSSSNSQPVIIG